MKIAYICGLTLLFNPALPARAQSSGQPVVSTSQSLQKPIEVYFELVANPRGLLKFDLFLVPRKTRLLRTLHNRFVSFG